MSSEAEDYGAEIVFNSAGNRVFVSSRVTGVLVEYSLDPNTENPARSCSITAPGLAFYPGRGPSCLVTSDQRGDSLQIMHVMHADDSDLLYPG